MKKRVVYLNGEFLEESKAKLSIYDRGFLFGDAVFEAGRTFNHKPFKLKEHIDRLFRSLRYTRIEPHLTPREINDITLEVLKVNDENLAPNDDFIYYQRVSRGEGLYMSHYPIIEPTILIYCQPIDFKSFAQQYFQGIHLIMATTRHLPSACLDPRVKVQSRIVNIMADLEVKTVDPSAYALMLDIHGFLSEGPSFNIFITRGHKLFTPRSNSALEGITRQTILELAEELGMASYETDLSLYDLYNAEEIFIAATSFEILPVSKLNNKPLTGPIPGPITEQLISALGKQVGVDIVQRAQSHLAR